MRISGTEPSSVILSQTVNIMFFEQNRESAEWYSRWKVEKRHTKFKKTALNNWSISKSKKKGDGTRCLVTSVANAPRKHLLIR